MGPTDVTTGALRPLECSAVPETWLGAAERRTCGALFPQHWREAHPHTVESGWTLREPAWRVLVTCDGELVAQACLVVLSCDLVGLADAAVEPAWRGLGLGEVLVEAAVGLCDRLGLWLAMGCPVPHMRAALARHGGAPADPARLGRRDGGSTVTWMLRPGAGRCDPVTLDGGL